MCILFFVCTCAFYHGSLCTLFHNTRPIPHVGLHCSRPLELDTDGIWCVLPSSFPESFEVRTVELAAYIALRIPSCTYMLCMYMYSVCGGVLHVLAHVCACNACSMCVCVCVHVHVHVLYVHAFVHVRMCGHSNVHVCMCACVNVHVHVHVCGHMLLYCMLQVCAGMCRYVCVHV